MNKKFLSFFAFLTLLTICITPIFVSAAEMRSSCEINPGFQVGTTVCPQGTCVYDESLPGYNVNCGICCMVNTVNKVSNWIFYVLTVIAIIFILIGGITFVTNSGDPAKAGAARSYIIYAAVGIAIGLIAKAIPALVGFIVG